MFQFSKIVLTILLLVVDLSAAAVSSNDVLNHDVNSGNKPNNKRMPIFALDDSNTSGKSHIGDLTNNASKDKSTNDSSSSSNNSSSKKESEPGTFSHQFNTIDEDYDSYDYSIGEDDSSYYHYDDESMDTEDADYVREHENHMAEKVSKPQIGKCCQLGRALNAQGICTEMKDMFQKKHNK